MNDTHSPVRFSLAAGAIALALALASTAFAQTAAADVRQAVEIAARQRLGSAVDVSVEILDTTVSDGGDVTAAPEPGSRTGSPARFVLSRQNTRVGYAVAIVQARGAQVRAVRELPRDAAIRDRDIESVDESLVDAPLKRVPGVKDVIGAHPRRNIAAGERLTADIIVIPPTVRSGDPVTMTIRIGAVAVTAKAFASGSGQVGDAIRVRGVGSKRVVSARITAPGAVEVIQ